jgi:hypothetical protein
MSTTFAMKVPLSIPMDMLPLRNCDEPSPMSSNVVNILNRVGQSATNVTGSGLLMWIHSR